MTKTQSVKRVREVHHAALAALAASLGGAHKDGINGLALWRKLHRIEVQITKATTAYCNGEMGEVGIDQACDRAIDAVRRAFGGVLPPKFHINRDPRGYALKLESNDDGTIATQFHLHRDWGNNQILAPTID